MARPCKNERNQRGEDLEDRVAHQRDARRLDRGVALSDAHGVCHQLGLLLGKLAAVHDVLELVQQALELSAAEHLCAPVHYLEPEIKIGPIASAVVLLLFQRLPVNSRILDVAATEDAFKNDHELVHERVDVALQFGGITLTELLLDGLDLSFRVLHERLEQAHRRLNAGEISLLELLLERPLGALKSELLNVFLIRSDLQHTPVVLQVGICDGALKCIVVQAAADGQADEKWLLFQRHILSRHVLVCGTRVGEFLDAVVELCVDEDSPLELGVGLHDDRARDSVRPLDGGLLETHDQSVLRMDQPLHQAENVVLQLLVAADTEPWRVDDVQVCTVAVLDSEDNRL